MEEGTTLESMLAPLQRCRLPLSARCACLAHMRRPSCDSTFSPVRGQMRRISDQRWLESTGSSQLRALKSKLAGSSPRVSRMRGQLAGRNFAGGSVVGRGWKSESHGESERLN